MKRALLQLFILLISICSFSQKSISPELQATKEYLGEERRSLFSRNMKLNILDLKRFWPIYDSYEKEREVIAIKQLNLTRKYIDEHKTMTDIELDLIQNQMFSLEKKSDELQEKYYIKMKERFGTTPAVRFIQIDNQISTHLSFELQKLIPLEGVTSKEEREKLEEQERSQIKSENEGR